MEIWAIIPVKRLEHAKSRLSMLLDRSERAELALAMFCDVLDTLAKVQGLAGVLVVTNDIKAAVIARQSGAAVLSDMADEGTNQAVKHGLAWLRQKEGAGAIVIPGDIPFATAEEITTVVGELKDRDVVLVPAVRDGGTNVLAMVRPDTIQVAFGEDSYNSHLVAAWAAGIEPRILYLEGAGHDIDVSSDLFCNEGDGPAPRTRALLKGLARRKSAPPTTSFKEILQP
jgi:FO synthase/2-phospho-L-lactate guanylyltransferase